MKCRANSIIALIAGVLLAATCLAQNGRGHDQRHEERQEHRGFQPPPGKSGGFGPARNSSNGNAQQQPAPQAQPQRQNGGLRFYGPGPHAGDWLRRNRNLPYDQQLRQLQSDPTFRSLPPQQQQRLEDRLHQFNSMSPEQQDRFLNHVDEYEHMPPGARVEVQDLYRREQGLPPSRQQAVRNAVRELNSLSPEQRQERLSSQDYRSRFTDSEREIIGQELQLRNPPTHLRPDQQGEPPDPEP
jgi:hypothetical protein